MGKNTKEGNVNISDKTKIMLFMFDLGYIWSEDAKVFYYKGHYMQTIERNLAEYLYYRVNLKD